MVDHLFYAVGELSDRLLELLLFIMVILASYPCRMFRLAQQLLQLVYFVFQLSNSGVPLALRFPQLLLQIVSLLLWILCTRVRRALKCIFHEHTRVIPQVASNIDSSDLSFLLVTFACLQASSFPGYQPYATSRCISSALQIVQIRDNSLPPAYSTLLVYDGD